MNVFLLGCPRPVGGANSEAGHTALLWRKMGISVTVIPTWEESPDNPWPKRLHGAGCRIVMSGPKDLHRVPGLSGGIAVAFCNGHACDVWPQLEAIGCRLIYSPCMCYTRPQEVNAFRRVPPTAVHFQSQYQRAKLGRVYECWGTPAARHCLIRGAFDVRDFPFRPKTRERRFVVGRLARSEPTKWPRDLFEILANVRRHGIDVRGRFQGWSAELEKKCGKPPSWADCFDEGRCTASSFLYGCHALLCLSGGDEENWPRVGLESMAAGVPVVADAQWGWCEMLDHGRTGFLCETHAEATAALTRLAANEPLRLELAHAARAAVEKLTDGEPIGQQWKLLFEALA